MVAVGTTTASSSTAIGTAGQLPTLTPHQIVRTLIQPLETASVFLSQGVRFFDGSGAPVRVPKAGGPQSASFVAENGAIPEITWSESELVLLPSTLQGVKSITRMSNQLVRQHVTSLEAAVQYRLTKDVASALDVALISGAGDGVTQPLSLLSGYTGEQVMAAVGAPTIDLLYDQEQLALAAEVDPGNLRWMMNSRLWKFLKKLKATGTGNYFIQPDPTQAGRQLLLGYPVTITERVPTTGTSPKLTQAVLWDPSQVAVARDLNVSVTFLRELYAANDQTGIRVIVRMDAAPLQPAAIVRSDGWIVT